MALKFVLTDIGNVLLEVDLHGRHNALAKHYALDPQQVKQMLYDKHMFHALERGTISWEVYRDTRLAHLREMGAVLPEDAAAHFERLWLNAVRGTIEPIIRLWLSLRNAVAIVSVSNVDPHSYAHGVRRYPQVTGCLTHEDTHSFRFGRRKGDADYFPALLAHLGAQPDECMLVDDLLENVLAARAHGIAAFHLDRIDTATLCELKARLVEAGVPHEFVSSDSFQGMRC